MHALPLNPCAVVRDLFARYVLPRLEHGPLAADGSRQFTVQL
jgi:hypothetical protein